MCVFMNIRHTSTYTYEMWILIKPSENNSKHSCLYFTLVLKPGKIACNALMND
jgi:hypothetical protein